MDGNKREKVAFGLIIVLIVIIVFAGKYYVDDTKASSVTQIESTEVNHFIIGYTEAEKDSLISVAEGKYNGRAKIVAGKSDKGSSIKLEVAGNIDNQEDIRDYALGFVSVSRELSALVPSDYCLIEIVDGTKVLRFELTSEELNSLNVDTMRSLFNDGNYKKALEMVNYSPSAEVSKLID